MIEDGALLPVCEHGLCHRRNISDVRVAPPALLHQAWRSTDVEKMEARLAACVRSWRVVNPSLRQTLYDDALAAAFVRRHYPQWASLYFELALPIERSDVFRYLVVHHYGGWWADIDTFSKRPLAGLSGDLIVGREPQNNVDGFGVLQYFFGATPRHPFFSDYLMPMIARRARRRGKDGLGYVLWTTGPQVFTAAYKSYVRSTLAAGGRAPRRVQWDEHILPTCAFGAWCFDCEQKGFRPYVEHLFLGSWRGLQATNWSAACPPASRPRTPVLDVSTFMP